MNWFDDKVFILRDDGVLHMANVMSEQGTLNGLSEQEASDSTGKVDFKDMGTFEGRHLFLVKSQKKTNGLYTWYLVEFDKNTNQDFGEFFDADFQGLPITISPSWPRHGVHLFRQGTYIMFFGSNLTDVKFGIKDPWVGITQLKDDPNKLRLVRPKHYGNVGEIGTVMGDSEIPYKFSLGCAVVLTANSSIKCNIGGFSIKGTVTDTRSL